MAYSMNFENINKSAEVINQLAIFLRTARVHDINNTAVISATDKFVSLVNDIIGIENSIVLEIRGSIFILMITGYVIPLNIYSILII